MLRAAPRSIAAACSSPVLAVLVVLGAGCGQGDAARREAFTKALTTQFQAVDGSPLHGLDEARCAAAGVVDALDTHQLIDLGAQADASAPIDPAAFSDDDLIVVASAAVDCVALGAIVPGILDALRPPVDTACVDRALPDGFRNRTIGAFLVGADPIAYEAFFETLTLAEEACATS